MKTHNLAATEGTIRSYIIGFILSLVLTFAAYFAVTEKLFTNTLLITVLLILATIQLIVQLLFFLHLGREKNPRWQLFFLISTLSGILLLIVGSIWIMNHLNYNMMPPQQLDQSIMNDEGIQR